jgi:hypothetical protein
VPARQIDLNNKSVAVKASSSLSTSVRIVARRVFLAYNTDSEWIPSILESDESSKERRKNWPRLIRKTTSGILGTLAHFRHLSCRQFPINFRDLEGKLGEVIDKNVVHRTVHVGKVTVFGFVDGDAKRVNS